jgi:hypothetical protein
MSLSVLTSAPSGRPINSQMPRNRLAVIPEIYCFCKAEPAGCPWFLGWRGEKGEKELAISRVTVSGELTLPPCESRTAHEAPLPHARTRWSAKGEASCPKREGGKGVCAVGDHAVVVAIDR